MKFKLKNGSIITGKEMLEKDDCGCNTDILPSHKDIPHWVYMDNLTHEMNQKYLEKLENGTGNYLSYLAFCQEESARLKEKLYQMNTHSVVEIIRE